MATVRLEHLHKSFGTTPILQDVTLAIDEGEFVVFVGPSGCGKSTLLRLIAGLDTVSQGEIWIGDTNVTDLAPAGRGVSMVFQSYALYPHMTVYKNIAFGLTLSGTATETIDERVRRVAAMLQIETLLDRKPRQLSGGQRQRVAIARAIVREPKVFLFDEPLSNLDSALRAQTRVEIAAMHETLGATMIYVTHDQVEAMTLADRIVVLNRGRVEQVGTPAELYHRPANLFVAQFLGTPQMNVFPASVRDGAVWVGGEMMVSMGDMELSSGVSDVAQVGVRAEDLYLIRDDRDAARYMLSAKVVRVEELGETRLVHARLDDGEAFVVRDRSEPIPRKGEFVKVGVYSDRYHLFDGDGNRVHLLS